MTLYMRETESHKWRDKETFETPEALSDWCQSTYYLELLLTRANVIDSTYLKTMGIVKSDMSLWGHLNLAN